MLSQSWKSPVKLVSETMQGTRHHHAAAHTEKACV